jgi:hypothetical protein
MKKTAMMVALATATFSPGAFAALPVIDLKAVAQMLKDSITNAAQWARTLQHYAAQVAHYENMVVTLKARVLQFGRIQHSYKVIPVTQDVDELCRSSGNAAVNVQTVMASPVNLGKGGNLSKAQNDFCVQKVINQNDAYNAAVTYLGEIEKDVMRLQETYVMMTSIGKSSANAAQVQAEFQRLQLKIEQTKIEFDAHMTQNGAVDSMVDRRQAATATQILKGKPSVINAIVETGVLAAALRL